MILWITILLVIIVIIIILCCCGSTEENYNFIDKCVHIPRNIPPNLQTPYDKNKIIYSGYVHDIDIFNTGLITDEHDVEFTLSGDPIDQRDILHVELTVLDNYVDIGVTDKDGLMDKIKDYIGTIDFAEVMFPRLSEFCNKHEATLWIESIFDNDMIDSNWINKNCDVDGLQSKMESKILPELMAWEPLGYRSAYFECCPPPTFSGVPNGKDVLTTIIDCMPRSVCVEKYMDEHKFIYDVDDLHYNAIVYACSNKFYGADMSHSLLIDNYLDWSTEISNSKHNDWHIHANSVLADKYKTKVSSGLMGKRIYVQGRYIWDSAHPKQDSAIFVNGVYKTDNIPKDAKDIVQIDHYEIHPPDGWAFAYNTNTSEILDLSKGKPKEKISWRLSGFCNSKRHRVVKNCPELQSSRETIWELEFPEFPPEPKIGDKIDGNCIVGQRYQENCFNKKHKDHKKHYKSNGVYDGCTKVAFYIIKIKREFKQLFDSKNKKYYTYRLLEGINEIPSIHPPNVYGKTNIDNGEIMYEISLTDFNNLKNNKKLALNKEGKPVFNVSYVMGDPDDLGGIFVVDYHISIALKFKCIECMNDCSNQGSCNLGVCTCNKNHLKEDCSFSCETDIGGICNAHGKCGTDGCVCDDGFGGEYCQTVYSNFEPKPKAGSGICSGHGAKFKGKCKCDITHTGTNCEIEKKYHKKYFKEEYKSTNNMGRLGKHFYNDDFFISFLNAMMRAFVKINPDDIHDVHERDRKKIESIMSHLSKSQHKDVIELRKSYERLLTRIRPNNSRSHLRSMPQIHSNNYNSRQHRSPMYGR